MKKDDYKTEFEEDRKEIDLNDSNGTGNRPSRVELHRKGRKPKKKSNHKMINIILGLFTLIMVIIFVYVVTDFYSPSDNPSAKVEDTPVRYETGNNTADGEKDDKNKDIASGDKGDDEKGESAEDGKGVGKVESEKPTDAETKPGTETKPEEKPETKPVVNVNPPTEKKPVEKPEQQPTGKTHKVATNETLYRISVNYYGSDIGVEKIKKANGLSSNDIMVGQTLIIP